MGAGGDDRTQHILIGIGLAAVGAFFLLSLFPVALLGEGAADLFPSGNLVGPVGAAVASVLFGSFGIAAAVVPLFAIIWGVWTLNFLERKEAGRWTLFLTAILAIVPPLIASFAHPANAGSTWAAGDYGSWAGGRLSAGIGWIGAVLLLTVAFVGAVIAILGVGPFQAVARGIVGVRTGASEAAKGVDAVLRGGAVVWGWMAAGSQRVAQGIDWLGERLTDRFSGSAASVPKEDPEAYRPESEPAAPKRKEKKPKKTERRHETPAELLENDLPPLELLSSPPDKKYSVSAVDLDRLGDTLVETLETFKVKGEIAGRTTGPVVTQFEVVPASGVKVGRIAALSDDLALALKAPSIRIIAPIPGKGAVGVEVPNPERKVVYLREILESNAYSTSRAQLPLALGENVTGRADVYDLAQMPHLLIAGVTGSGKSVCINAIISSLIYRYTPDELRLLLIDPKMVELGGYNVLPHLRHKVVTDNRDAATVLKWLVYEMERRYAWLSVNGCRNLREYNRRVTRGLPVRAPDNEGGVEVEEPEILPYVVLVVDELADLMMTVQNEVERPLAYLAQKARATGIHLVVATQRPSVNVITGLIKANFPCRAAFRVASKVDSRTIIDQNGAETLLGNGDMLLMPPGQAEPVRIQGTFVSTGDTERLMDWYRAKAELKEAMAAADEEDILESVHQREMEEAELEMAQDELEDRDPLFRRAAEVVIQHQQGSTSLLQRRLKVGYGRAARIVDQLEHAGIVGPPEGSKPREVLFTLQDLDRISSQGSD